MTKLEKLNSQIVNILTKRLGDEYNAFYLYNHISNWCQNEGYEKAAKYFANESKDELEHAKKIEAFMIDWNVTPSLPVIKAPSVSLSNLGDCVDAAYTAELELYESYESDSNDIFKSGDTCVFDFLMFFRDVQQKSVAEFATMQNKLKGINVNDKFQMLMLEKTLF